MTKLVFIFFSFFFFLSCTKDSSDGGLSIDGQLNLSLNLIKDFSLHLDQTTSKSNFHWHSMNAGLKVNSALVKHRVV